MASFRGTERNTTGRELSLHEPGSRRRSSRSVAVLSFAAIVLVSAGCGGDGDDDASVDPIATESADSSTPGGSASTETDPGADTSSVAPAGGVDASEAASIAGSEGPGTVVDLDRDGRRWEVEVLLEDGTGIELDIDADTGEVVRRSAESVPTAPPIGIEEAMTSALEAAPGGAVTQAELDDEGGRTTWEIAVDLGSGDEVDVHVDATTAEVVSVDDD